MIRKWHAPGQLLLVEKKEHEKIILSKLVSIRNKLPSLTILAMSLDVVFCRT
jgi:hypothetical protein